MNPEFVTTEELIQEAYRNIEKGAWGYLVGGSESETTLRRNRLAFDRWAFRPRVLVDITSLDASTTFLGHKMRIPVMLAPIGSMQTFDPEGGAGATKGAAEFGTIHVVSSVTRPTLEEISAAADNVKIFQLYVYGDWGYIEETVARMKEAGYKAFCLTVDTASYSRRERPMLDRWAQRSSPQAPVDRSFGAAVTWDTLDKIKSIVDMPFLVKGIATAEDARIAVDHGVDVVWISNHGGRQLDHGQGTMDVLPEVVEAVDGKADVMLDGGVLRGTDVLKALALGAKAVAIGKLQAWGLAANGSAGVRRVLEILEDEIISGMGLMGVTSVDQLTTNYVTRAEPVTMPHEMSAWVNMPVDRIR